LVEPKKPTRAELQALTGKIIPDWIAPNLRILLVGINPSLYTAYTGYPFAFPGNRFWPTLYNSGLTDRLFAPSEVALLVARGIGITGLARRATATADELTKEELIEGGQQLIAKIEQNRPRAVGVLGISAYRTAFNRPKAQMGRQSETLGGVPLWLLPNPSGLNAHYNLERLAQVFREFRLEVEALKEF
jgi:TDG/mug DNA glycosylase family protein